MCVTCATKGMQQLNDNGYFKTRYQAQKATSTPFLTATRYYLDFDLPVHFQSPGCAATHVGLHRAPVFKSSAHTSE
jgi:hypothetical protein